METDPGINTDSKDPSKGPTGLVYVLRQNKRPLNI
jgi:hypothetical protein